jgi:hypothetical protein
LPSLRLCETNWYSWAAQAVNYGIIQNHAGEAIGLLRQQQRIAVLIQRNLRAEGPRTLQYDGALETLAGSLARGECLPFLGAGASLDDTIPSDLPQGWELAKTMTEQLGLKWHDHLRLSTAAFYYEFFRGGRKALNSLLRETIGNPKIPPSAAIRKLIKILRIAEASEVNGEKIKTVVATTNYDQQFERAYQEEFQRQPSIIVYQGAWNPLEQERISLNVGLNHELDRYGIAWFPTTEPTTLYKIHGCISLATDSKQNLVITDEDYINFLANSLASVDEERRLLTHFTRRFKTNRILFIGYSLEDWNFRVVFKSTAEQRKDNEFSYAVQYYPNYPAETREEQARIDATESFWHDKRVHILNVRASDFLGDLLEMMPAAEAGAVGR